MGKGKNLLISVTCVIAFNFSVGYEELKQRYLQFSVYDFDRFSRHDLIGHVVLKGLLDNTDLHQELEFTMNVLCAPQVSRMSHFYYLPSNQTHTCRQFEHHKKNAIDQ